MVAIDNINPPRTTWVLPQLYLAAVSPCLEMVFKKEQTEPTRHHQLDGVSPEIFGLFVEWLNGRKLVNSSGIPHHLLQVPGPYYKEDPGQEA